MDVDERSLEAGVPRLEAGTLFAGRYRIRSFLGEGQRKHTYLACDTTLSDRRVALALVKPAAMQSDPEATRRETAALVQSGNHDNIVTLHDSGVCDGVEYLVIAYLCGGTLKGLLKARSEQGNPPSVDEVMQWGRQLARALSHTHQKGLVHRDVASGNVWLDERMV